MLHSEFIFGTRVGVLIPASEHHKHADGAGVGAFKFGLREACVIAGNLIELAGEGGVVAGVTKHGPE